MRVLRMVRAAWRQVARHATPRVRRRTAVVIVALVGAWLGLLVGGQVTAPIGPVNANLSIRPSLTGNTFIDVAPLGSIELDTTDSPLALDASVAEIRVSAVQAIFRDPTSLEDLQAQVISDLLAPSICTGTNMKARAKSDREPQLHQEVDR